ncbi:hypothetical protein ACJJTC_007037, partial [Scirpophaga incertulas]
KIPRDCLIEINGLKYGSIGTHTIKESCKEQSRGQALEVLWTIKTPENTDIYLNFTSYHLQKPNECEENLIQVFGAKTEDSSRLAHYCGLVANPVSTKDDDRGAVGNIIHIRFFVSLASLEKSTFNATFTAYRTLDPSKDERCDPDEEFDCEDNTCIHNSLKCDKYAHCRLKADEDPDLCKGKAESMLNEPHILAILIIFVILITGMFFKFVYKFGRKLWRDQKVIKDHIQQSCEERIDSLVGSRLTLDAKALQRECQRMSLEIENHTNEMYKRQRSLSKQTNDRSSSRRNSIELSNIDVDGQWRPPSLESVHCISENVPMGHHNVCLERHNVHMEHHIVHIENHEIPDENRIHEVHPSTVDNSCQTRDSLFDNVPGHSSGARFSTFGYPAPNVEIDLGDDKSDSERPGSSETTRSAPDVIIVSKLGR